MKIQCARLEGLDSKEGLLLLGTTHFYVIEGLTLTRTGEIADLENLAIEYVQDFMCGYDWLFL